MFFLPEFNEASNKIKRRNYQFLFPFLLPSGRVSHLMQAI
jgi:hypothetical protein